MSTVKIDNKEYKLEELSKGARGQLASIQVATQKISQLKSDLALAQTARNAYAQVLSTKLPEKEAAKNKKNAVITIDKKRYSIEELSADAKAQIANLQFADRMIANIQSEIAVASTAKNAYSKALGQLLKKESK